MVQRSPCPRIIGHFAYAPATRTSARGLLRDWALIQLDAANAFATQPTNTVYIGSSIAAYQDKCENMPSFVFRKDGFENRIDEHGFLHLDGNVPIPNHGRIQHMHVGMRGRSKKLRFGHTNNILAIRRQPRGGEKFLVWEWIVLPAMGDTPSSVSGDSGSAVWEHEGRVIGIVTGGVSSPHDIVFAQTEPWTVENQNLPLDFTRTGIPDSLAISLAAYREPHVDITFITPIEYIFEGIEAFTGQKVSIL